VPVGVNGERERRTGTSYYFSILYADPRLCVIEHTWALSPYVHCKHYGLQECRGTREQLALGGWRG
jgi:hypothetical protein